VSSAVLVREGKPCEFDTPGLLLRAHIVAKCPPIHIGKESDKHWKEGEDLSLLEFKTIEYKRKGYAISTDEELMRIEKVPKREFMRWGINQHALERYASESSCEQISWQSACTNSNLCEVETPALDPADEICSEYERVADPKC